MNMQEYLYTQTRGQTYSNPFRIFEGGPGSGVIGHTTNNPDETSNSKTTVNDAIADHKAVMKKNDAIWKKYGDNLSEEDKKLRYDELQELRKKEYDPLLDKVLSHRESPPPNLKFGNGDTGVVRDAQKGNGGHIEEMSPDDYLKLVNIQSDDDIKTFLSLFSVDDIYNGLKSGNEYEPGFLDYSNGEITDHEGRHRAIVARMMGIEKIPVAIIGRDHKDFDILNTKSQDMNYRKESVTKDKRFREGGIGSGVVGHHTNHPPEYISQLDNIAKSVLSEIPESHPDGTSKGACRDISSGIFRKLKYEMGYDKRIDTKEVALFNGDSISHGVTILPDDGLIIDTQVHQFTFDDPSVKDLSKRKVIFTEDEYKSLGFDFEDNRMAVPEGTQ